MAHVPAQGSPAVAPDAPATGPVPGPFAPAQAPGPFAPGSAPGPFAPGSAPGPFAPGPAPGPFAPAPAPERDAQGDGVRAVLTRLEALTARDVLTIDDILEAFGETAFLPVLMVLALVVVSPLSGVPFLPTTLGTIIALVSLQMLVGRPGIWLPRVLARRRLAPHRLNAALRRLHRVADRVDASARDRLPRLVSPPLDTLPKAACIPCGGAMPFLEIVPFSSSILGVAILLFATALLTRDGLFALAGFVTMAVAASIPLALYGGMLRAML